MPPAMLWAARSAYVAYISATAAIDSSVCSRNCFGDVGQGTGDGGSNSWRASHRLNEAEDRFDCVGQERKVVYDYSCRRKRRIDGLHVYGVEGVAPGTKR